MSSTQIVIKSQFLTTLFELPLVATAIDMSSRTYQSTKISNALFNKTLSAVEDTAYFVVNNSQPIFSFFERPATALGVGQVLTAADNVAVKALKDVEAIVLFITKPTGQVLQEVKDIANSITSRITVTVSPITNRVTLVRVLITDGLDSSYNFLLRLIRDLIAVTNGQMESTATVFLQVIGFSALMNYIHFYIDDIQTRRNIIAGMKLPSNGPSSESFVTMESLDGGYLFGLHFFYAKAVNSILTLEYTLSSSTSCILSVLKYHSSWKEQEPVAIPSTSSTVTEGDDYTQLEEHHD